MDQNSYSFRGQMGYLRDNHPIVLWIVAIATLILLVFTFTRTRNSTNTRSRIITVERMVEEGTMAHFTKNDTTPFRLSKDAVMIGDKMYSSKPPNYPFLMAGEAWLMKQLTGLSFYPHKKDYIRMLTLVNQVIPYMIMVLLALAMASWYFRDRWTLVMFALSMTVGLLPFAYSVTINNHSIAAVSFFIAFYLLWLIFFQNRKSIWVFLGLGLLAGFGASVDLPGYSFVALATLAALYKNIKKGWWTVLGVLIPLAVTLFTYQDLTGSFKPIYMQGDLYHFEDSYWDQREGFDALRESKRTYLFHIMLGHHGLFSLSPVLILGALGLVSILKNREWEVWKFFAGISICILAIFAFVLFRTTNYGGYAIGMRWFLLFMPLMMFGALPLLQKMGEKLWTRIVVVLLLILSTPAVAQALYYEAFYRSFLDQWLVSFN